MPDFDGANILITGAASGIGAATASLLAGRGAKKLILIDRDEDRLRDFAFSLPCERQIIIGDVTQERLWFDADLTGLTHALETYSSHYRAHPADAADLLTTGAAPADPDLDPVEIATWTLVANHFLNLDETLVK